MKINFKGTKGSWFIIKVTDHPLNTEEQVAFIQTATHAFDISAVQSSIVDRDTFKANAQLIAHAPEMLEAMQEFCDRVERGEVRSKKTYALFKDLLTRATAI